MGGASGWQGPSELLCTCLKRRQTFQSTTVMSVELHLGERRKRTRVLPGKVVSDGDVATTVAPSLPNARSQLGGRLERGVTGTGKLRRQRFSRGRPLAGN